jgi:DNA-binding transcriptional MerR regulator
MNKKEAAEYLDVSTRAIERYTKQGKLTVKYEKGKTRSIAIYDQAELERLKEELNTPVYKPSVEITTNTDNSDIAPVGIPQVLEKIGFPILDLLTKLNEKLSNLEPDRQPLVPVEEKLLCRQ